MAAGNQRSYLRAGTACRHSLHRKVSCSGSPAVPGETTEAEPEQRRSGRLGDGKVSRVHPTIHDLLHHERTQLRIASKHGYSAEPLQVGKIGRFNSPPGSPTTYCAPRTGTRIGADQWRVSEAVRVDGKFYAFSGAQRAGHEVCPYGAALVLSRGARIWQGAELEDVALPRPQKHALTKANDTGRRKEKGDDWCFLSFHQGHLHSPYVRL